MVVVALTTAVVITLWMDVIEMAVCQTCIPATRCKYISAPQVGLWDCLDTSSPTHGVQLFQFHSRPVNCLSWDSSSRLVSTSYDGTTKSLDVAHGSSSLLYCDPAFLEAGGWASSHCQPEGSSFLVSLGSQGTVVRVDPRQGALPVASYPLFHRMHAKTISCHPLQPHLLLTGHNKGGVFIFDLRGGAGKDGLLQPVTELLGATRSSSWQLAGLSPPCPGRSVRVPSRPSPEAR